MKLDKFVFDVKDKINVKNQLIEQKKQLVERLRNGRDYFIKATTTPKTPAELVTATKLMDDIIRQINEIEAQIIDTDVILVTMLEAYLSDTVMRCGASQKNNDAGDIINAKSFVFAPYKDNDDFVEITPDDLWFLKIIKSAIGIRNVEVISKNDYYSK